jgi:hypothetical protein
VETASRHLFFVYDGLGEILGRIYAAVADNFDTRSPLRFLIESGSERFLSTTDSYGNRVPAGVDGLNDVGHSMLPLGRLSFLKRKIQTRAACSAGLEDTIG